MSADVRAAIAAHAATLSQRVLDRMYENPFWMERYGERGRRFANEDSLHHIGYLDQALAADDPTVFERYATWLRSVLVSRGMCSEHLAENFRLLAGAIAADGLDEAKKAEMILLRGDAALRYTNGPAATLDASREYLTRVVNESPQAPSREDDRRYLVSYLIDAAATGDDRAFALFAARFPDAVGAALRAAAAAITTSNPAAPDGH